MTDKHDVGDKFRYYNESGLRRAIRLYSHDSHRNTTKLQFDVRKQVFFEFFPIFSSFWLISNLCSNSNYDFFLLPVRPRSHGVSLFSDFRFWRRCIVLKSEVFCARYRARTVGNHLPKALRNIVRYILEDSAIENMLSFLYALKTEGSGAEKPGSSKTSGFLSQKILTTVNNDIIQLCQNEGMWIQNTEWKTRRVYNLHSENTVLFEFFWISSDFLKLSVTIIVYSHFKLPMFLHRLPQLLHKKRLYTIST